MPQEAVGGRERRFGAQASLSYQLCCNSAKFPFLGFILPRFLHTWASVLHHFGCTSKGESKASRGREVHTCKNKCQVLCTSLTLGSEWHEKAQQSHGSKASSQITSVFTLRFPQGYLKTPGKMSSQSKSYKGEWDWNCKSISPVVWFQASSWLSFIISTEEWGPHHWGSLHWMDFYSHFPQHLELGLIH